MNVSEDGMLFHRNAVLLSVDSFFGPAPAE